MTAAVDTRRRALAQPQPSPLADAEEKLEAIRLFIQDCLDQHPDRATIGNLMSARDEVDALLAAVRGDRWPR